MHPCRALHAHYRQRVLAFLKAPPREWLRACAYDEHPYRFYQDVAAWHAAVRTSLRGRAVRHEKRSHK